MSSYNAVRSYFSEKRVTGSQILSFSVLAFISFFLIFGGVLILQSEDIFRRVYEGFVTTLTVTNSTATGTCPTGTTKYSYVTNGNTGYICISDCATGETLYYPGSGGSVIGTTLDISKSIGGFDTDKINTPNGFHCRANTTNTSSSEAGTSTKVAPSSGSRWTADLPEDLTLGQLQKNVNLIRKESTVNKVTGISMIVSGSVIILYQTYKLFF